MMTASGPACSKCGTIKKSGELSCCVRGGDWFKNCGNPGDKKFDHTWSEGIQACSGAGKSFAVHEQEASGSQTVNFTIPGGDETNVIIAIANSQGCAELTNTIVTLTILIVYFCLQM